MPSDRRPLRGACSLATGIRRRADLGFVSRRDDFGRPESSVVVHLYIKQSRPPAKPYGVSIRRGTVQQRGGETQWPSASRLGCLPQRFARQGHDGHDLLLRIAAYGLLAAEGWHSVRGEQCRRALSGEVFYGYEHRARRQHLRFDPLRLCGERRRCGHRKRVSIQRLLNGHLVAGLRRISLPSCPLHCWPTPWNRT